MTLRVAEDSPIMHALNPGVVGAVRAAIEARLAAPGTNRRRPAPAAEWGLAMPGDQPGQRGKPQPVAWLVADLAGLAAQHCVLMPEDQELGVIGHLTPARTIKQPSTQRTRR